MIEFHPGPGPDSEAVGVALEEMFFDYQVASAMALPAILDGGERIEGAKAILLHLSARSGRFLPEHQRGEIVRWLDLALNNVIDANTLEMRLAASPYILGDFSIADMAVYPMIARLAPGALPPKTALWIQRISERSATGRGMGAIAR